MKIIVGLGNPGIKYAGTRHNTGFSVITGLSDEYDIRLNKRECMSVTGHGVIAGEKVILAEPQTYMNLSGEAVSELLHFYKSPIEDLIVIYDDIDLDVGRIRIRDHGSAGGHNGIRNIIQHLGTDTFDRIKVGVGAKPEGGDLINHVLGRIPADDLPLMREAVSRAVAATEEIIRAGASSAMNKYN